MKSCQGNWLKCIAFWVSCFVLLGIGTANAKSVKWDSLADWSKGNASNVTWTKKPGQLEIVFDPSSVVQTPFIYIPNSSLNTITKMDTTNGLILWTFNIGALNLGYAGNPSRTTVDSAGNVWVGLRGGSHVIAVSSAGKHLATVNIGKGPRAVTIDKDGHIWAGGYNAASIVKISKTTFRPLLTVRSSGICTYGATTDSDGNIWTLNRCKGNVAKISPSGQILKYVSTPGCYGIAADRVGNVWVASYERQVVFRINARTYAVNSYALGARGRGVGIDAKNRAWVACSTDGAGKTSIRHVTRVDPSNGRIDQFKNVGLHTIGVAIDSKGFVWANSYSEGRAYKLRVTDGTLVASYAICDVTGIRPCANTGCKACSSPAKSGPYTYSDMTGFSIQTRPAKGTYRMSFDAKCSAKFSKISWNGTTPKGTSIKVRARSASSKAGLASATWGRYVASGQSPSVASNRWIEFEFLMETSDARYTSVVSDATLDYDHFAEVCDGIDNNCDGSIDENYTDLGQSCKVGVGGCENTGKKVCNSAKNGTVCDVKPKAPGAEVCDGKDNNCNGKVDENFTDLGSNCTVGLGICKASGTRVCDASTTKTTCSAKPGTPQPEICDGLDNNCDGKVDEKWPNKGNSCDVGVGSCKNTGTWICKPDKSGVACSVPPKGPQPEICDGQDNDCNGKVDDGLIRSCSTKCGSGTQNCQAGKWVACSADKPRQETCNDKDDDCNGQVDDGLERVCSTTCGKGKESCVRGKWVFCSAKKSVPEVCDGQDNDCNGKVDEGLRPRRCLGDCGEGTATCSGGKWGGCSGPSPETETCDGKDNDCNGQIDDKLTKSCRTSCGEGRQVCGLGQWSVCNAPKAGKEICDSKDNDCDGKIDNGNGLCPASMLCQNGKCQQACRNGECPKGMRCINNACASEKDPCDGVSCPDGNICAGGRCIDKCYTVSCPTDQICEKGKCVEDNCYRKGCPNAQRCVSGKCESDPCNGISCNQGQFCREGKCIDSCAGVKCSGDETCVDGKCVKQPQDPCKGVSCNSGEHCVNGKCQADPCDGVECPKGRQCVNGQCQHDPCFNIFCPDGQTCVENQCVGDPGSRGENPGSDENGTGEEKPGNTADGGVTDTSTPKTDEDTGKGGDQPGLADKAGGKPNNLPDEGTTRYEPGNCGCHHQGGPAPLMLWLGMLFFLLYLRRLGFNRLK